MRPIFFYLAFIQLFLVGVRESFPKDPIELLLDGVNKPHIIYDFEQNRTKYRSHRMWSEDELAILQNALSDSHFSFDIQNDTILLVCTYVNYYISSPVAIFAFSSKEKKRLRIDSALSFKEIDTSNLQNKYCLYGEEDPLLEIIRNHDTISFSCLVDAYGESDAVSNSIDYAFRIVIVDGKYESITEWQFVINTVKYSDDLLNNSFKQKE